MCGGGGSGGYGLGGCQGRIGKIADTKCWRFFKNEHTNHLQVNACRATLPITAFLPQPGQHIGPIHTSLQCHLQSPPRKGLPTSSSFSRTCEESVWGTRRQSSDASPAGVTPSVTRMPPSGMEWDRMSCPHFGPPPSKATGERVLAQKDTRLYHRPIQTRSHHPARCLPTSSRRLHFPSWANCLQGFSLLLSLGIKACFLHQNGAMLSPETDLDMGSRSPMVVWLEGVQSARRRTRTTPHVPRRSKTFSKSDGAGARGGE